MVWCYNCPLAPLAARLAVLAGLLVSLDWVCRPLLVSSPAAVLAAYRRKLPGPRPAPGLGPAARARYLLEQCNLTGPTWPGGQEHFYQLKAGAGPGLLLCVPPRLAARAAVARLASAVGSNCTKLQDCAVKRLGETAGRRVLLVRHPLDRLVLEFRHSRPGRGPTRRLLYTRHRARPARPGPASQFRQFVVNTVLAADGPVRPLSQLCSVCHTRYHAVVRLEDGLENIQQILGGQASRDPGPGKTTKEVGPQARRKFYSEVTATELELIYNKFKQDFLLFGYSLDYYCD